MDKITFTRSFAPVQITTNSEEIFNAMKEAFLASDDPDLFAFAHELMGTRTPAAKVVIPKKSPGRPRKNAAEVCDAAMAFVLDIVRETPRISLQGIHESATMMKGRFSDVDSLGKALADLVAAGKVTMSELSGIPRYTVVSDDNG